MTIDTKWVSLYNWKFIDVQILLVLGGVPGLGCSATLSAACAATHFGVECKEKQEMAK